jgi:hypothetical protein
VELAVNLVHFGQITDQQNRLIRETFLHNFILKRSLSTAYPKNLFPLDILFIFDHVLNRKTIS